MPEPAVMRRLRDGLMRSGFLRSGRHGIDHGFHAVELFCIQLCLSRLRHTTHVRHLIEHGTDATHVFHLLQLIAEIFEIEAPAFLYLLGKLLRLLFVNLALSGLR